MQLSNFKKAAIQVGALMAVAAVLALWSCEKPPLNTDEAKKTVYNYLDSFSKDIIIGTWEDGEISEIDLDLKTADQYIPSENTDIEKYIDKTVYIVKFKTTSSGLLGDVNVIADRATGQIIASAPFE